jgi:hypothetical protein
MQVLSRNLSGGAQKTHENLFNSRYPVFRARCSETSVKLVPEYTVSHPRRELNWCTAVCIDENSCDPKLSDVARLKDLLAHTC